MNKEKQTEKRMYCLVAYNLSDIQKGIQAQHCVSELREWVEHCESPYEIIKYKDWIKNWKTTIVLNGGTTNGKFNDRDITNWGTLQKYTYDLHKLGVTFSEFSEPDLNDAITAVAFIVDMVEDSHIVQYLKSMNLA